jgi:signal transduction histidine kinase
MELTFISDKIFDLLGYESREVVGSRFLSAKRIAPQDLELCEQKLEELRSHKAVTWVHRLVNSKGLPVWVSHGLQEITVGSLKIYRGCLLEIGNELKARQLGSGTVERFIHKLGNHFTLLHVVLGSLKKVLPPSREAEVLHETVEKAIELTRSFSEYNQRPSCWMQSVDMFQVLQGAIIRVQPCFDDKGVALEEVIDPSLERVAFSGDPFLLELAVGRLLQNALEASSSGSSVKLLAGAEIGEYGKPAVRVIVQDAGTGVDEELLKQIFVPFFTTKEGHEGLGLNMACRFVEMHSGVLKFSSRKDKGTEVEIHLPATAAADPSVAG